MLLRISGGFFCHTFPADPRRYSVRHLPLGSLLAAALAGGEFWGRPVLSAECLPDYRTAAARARPLWPYSPEILLRSPYAANLAIVFAGGPDRSAAALADSTQHFPPGIHRRVPAVLGKLAGLL